MGRRSHQIACVNRHQNRTLRALWLRVLSTCYLTPNVTKDYATSRGRVNAFAHCLCGYVEKHGELTFGEACALATDENGFFSAKDVRAPLREITKRRCDIQAYIRHLNQFSQEARGPVLRKEGSVRRFQYSFVEPMMQPYALMKGLTDGLITEEQFSVL